MSLTQLNTSSYFSDIQTFTNKLNTHFNLKREGIKIEDFSGGMDISDKYIALGSRNSISLFEKSRFGKLIDQSKSLTAHSARITCLSLQDDSTLFSGSEDCTIRAWNLKKFVREDKEPTKEFRAHFKPISAILSMPDYLVSASEDKSLKIWDLSKITKEDRTPAHTVNLGRSTCRVMLGNLEQFFVGLEDGTIRNFNFTNFSKEKSNLEQIFTGHDEKVSCLALWNKILISGSDDSTIKGWNLARKAPNDKSPLFSIKAHWNSITSLITDQNLLFSGAGDHLIKVWKLSPIFPPRLIKSISAHTHKISSLKLLNNQLFSSGEDGTILTWSLPSTNKLHREAVKLWPGQDTEVSCLVVNQGLLFSSEINGKIKIWNLSKSGLEDRIPVRGITAHEGPVHSLVIGEELLYSGGDDRIIKGWSLTKSIEEDKHPEKTFVGHDGPIKSLVFAKGSLYSASDDCTIRVWNTSKSTKIDSAPRKLLLAHSAPVLCLTLDQSNPTTLFSGSADKTIKAWDLMKPDLGIEDREPTRTFLSHENAILSLAIGPGILYSGSADNTIKGWNLTKNGKEDKEPVKILQDHEEDVTSLALCQDLLYSGSLDSAIKAWNLRKPTKEDKEPLKSWKAHRNGILSMEAQDELLYSAGEEGEIKTWKFFQAIPLTSIERFDDITLDFFHELFYKSSSSQDIPALCSGMYEYLEEFYGRELDDFPLLLLLSLRSDPLVLEKYFSLYSHYSFPFINELTNFYFELKYQPEIRVTRPKSPPGLNYTDHSQQSQLENINLFSRGENTILSKNVLKTIIFLLKIISNPKHPHFRSRALGIHSLSCPGTFHQLLLINSSELRDCLSTLLLEVVTKLRTQLRKENDNIAELVDVKRENSSFDSILAMTKPDPQKLKDFSLEVSNFPLDISNGSPNSVHLFRQIYAMAAGQRRDYDPLIQLKWRKVKPWLLFQLLIFFSLTLLFNIYLQLGEQNWTLLGPILFLNTLVLIYETKSFLTVRGYLYSFYNYLDLAVILGVYGIALGNLLGAGRALSVVNFIFTLILNVRTLTYFRVIDSLRYLIEMVLNIYLDIRAFLALITMFILIYSVGLMEIDGINGKEERESWQSFEDKLKQGVVLAFGDWEVGDEWTYWNWILFLFGAVTFTIMLLNLIIAIVSKTFDDYFENQIDVDRGVKLKLILEIDQFLNWSCKSIPESFDEQKFEKEGRYYHLLRKEEEVNSFGDLGKKIDEKEEIYADKLEEMKLEMKNKADEIASMTGLKFEEMISRSALIEGKFEEIREENEQRFEEIKKREDLILKELRDRFDLVNTGNVGLQRQMSEKLEVVKGLMQRMIEEDRIDGSNVRQYQ